MVSQLYIETMTSGAFPEKVDPFTEAGRYYHQLHSEIISHILGQIRLPLLQMGYYAGRETSLQIAEHRQPDIYIKRDSSQIPQSKEWNYSQAAESIDANVGVTMQGDILTLDAVAIKEVQTGQLVTIIEVVSPRNKSDFAMIADYQTRRNRLLQKQVNVVEIDLTRSVKRLVDDNLVSQYAYHIAIHLYDQLPRFIGIDIDNRLPRFAIPLRGQVVAVELAQAYRHAYEQTSMAWQIQNETQYQWGALPFPTLLSATEQTTIHQQIVTWHQTLQSLDEEA